MLAHDLGEGDLVLSDDIPHVAGEAGLQIVEGTAFCMLPCGSHVVHGAILLESAGQGPCQVSKWIGGSRGKKRAGQ